MTEYRCSARSDDFPGQWRIAKSDNISESIYSSFCSLALSLNVSELRNRYNVLSSSSRSSQASVVNSFFNASIVTYPSPPDYCSAIFSLHMKWFILILVNGRDSSNLTYLSLKPATFGGVRSNPIDDGDGKKN